MIKESYKVIGNKLPKHQRWMPFNYWNRITVDKMEYPQVTARGECTKIYIKNNRWR